MSRLFTKLTHRTATVPVSHSNRYEVSTTINQCGVCPSSSYCALTRRENGGGRTLVCIKILRSDTLVCIKTRKVLGGMSVCILMRLLYRSACECLRSVDMMSMFWREGEPCFVLKHLQLSDRNCKATRTVIWSYSKRKGDARSPY